jgi:hypothetical protein
MTNQLAEQVIPEILVGLEKIKESFGIRTSAES